MNAIGMVIGGLIGGIIGAAIWVGIGYATGYEVGYIAWGVGFLVGLGVNIGAGEEDGFLPGGVATGIAILAVLGAKYMVVSLLASHYAGEFSTNLSADEIDVNTMIAIEADVVAEQYEADGRKLDWPQNVSDDAPQSASYPVDVWMEATQRWQSLPDQEKASRKAAHLEQIKEFTEQFRDVVASEVRDEALSESFSPWDLLWFGLAAFTAFRVGSGMVTDE